MANEKLLQGAIRFLPVAMLLAAPLFGQQRDVRRYDLYTGFSYFHSAPIDLSQKGVNFQFGIRPRTWYSLGVDFSAVTGDLTLTPDLLPTALQQQLGAMLGQLAAAGKLPPGYHLTVPADATTYAIAAGPQLAYRHFSKVTLFLRPNMGAVREGATPKPGDAIAAGVVKQLSPTGHKTDWQGFFGFGGGFDILFNKHFAWRVQADYVYDHLFNDILKDGRWTTRFSVGPAFNFGKNIVE